MLHTPPSRVLTPCFQIPSPALPQAALIEYNMAAVDAAIDALNAALGRGLDWRELAALIEAEKRAGNPVASTVGALHLERNAATLLLQNLLDEEEDSDEESAPPAAPQKVGKCQNRKHGKCDLSAPPGSAVPRRFCCHGFC